MSATAVLNLSKAGFTDAQVAALAERLNARVDLAVARVRRELEIEFRRELAARDLKASEARLRFWKRLATLVAIVQPIAIVVLLRLLP